MRLKITLPIPPSGNNTARKMPDGRRLSHSVRAYRDTVALELRAAGYLPHQGPAPYLPPPYRLDVILHMASLHRVDWDNAVKVLQDAICFPLWLNDALVVDARVRKVEEPRRGQARCEVVLETIAEGGD